MATRPNTDLNVRLPVQKGMVDLYFGENGMASVDAYLPIDVVLRMVAVARS